MEQEAGRVEPRLGLALLERSPASSRPARGATAKARLLTARKASSSCPGTNARVVDVDGHVGRQRPAHLQQRAGRRQPGRRGERRRRPSVASNAHHCTGPPPSAATTSTAAASSRRAIVVVAAVAGRDDELDVADPVDDAPAARTRRGDRPRATVTAANPGPPPWASSRRRWSLTAGSGRRRRRPRRAAGGARRCRRWRPAVVTVATPWCMDIDDRRGVADASVGSARHGRRRPRAADAPTGPPAHAEGPDPRGRPAARRDVPRRHLRARPRQPVRAAGGHDPVGPDDRRQRQHGDPDAVRPLPDGRRPRRRRPVRRRGDHPARPASTRTRRRA